MKKWIKQLSAYLVIASTLVSSIGLLIPISVKAVDKVVDGITVSTTAPNVTNFEQRFESDWVDASSIDEAFNTFKSQIQAVDCDYVYVQTANTICYHYYKYDHSSGLVANIRAKGGELTGVDISGGCVGQHGTFTLPACVTTDGQAHTYRAGSWGSGSSNGRGGYMIWGFRLRSLVQTPDGQIHDIVCSHIKDKYDKYIPGGALIPVYDWSGNHLWWTEGSSRGYDLNYGETPCDWRNTWRGMYGLHGRGTNSQGASVSLCSCDNNSICGGNHPGKCVSLHLGNGSPNPVEPNQSDPNGQGYCHTTTAYKVIGYRGRNYLVNYNSNKPLAALFETLSGTMEDRFYDLNKTYNLDINKYSITNWTFLGWNTKRDGTGTAYTDGQQFKNIGKAGDTITLYAQWKSNMDPNKIKYIDANNSVIYAQWEPIKYTVKIHPNNNPADATSIIQNIGSLDYTWDEGGKFYSKIYTYDKDALDSAENFYKLKGWHIDRDYLYTNDGINGEASGKQYKIGEKNLTSIQDDVIDLYPKWIKNTYYIKYSGNNTERNIYGDIMTTEYTGNTTDTECLYDTDVGGEIQTPDGRTVNCTIKECGFSRKGYHFKEWNTQPDGKGVPYMPGDHLTKPNFTDVENGSITFYAIWEPDFYDIEFHTTDGGIFINWDECFEQYKEYYKSRFNDEYKAYLESYIDSATLEAIWDDQWDACKDEHKLRIRFDSVNNITLSDMSKFAHTFGGWAKDQQYDIKEDGTFPDLDISNFFTPGDHVLSVSGQRGKKTEADIHFNPFTEELDLWAWYNRKPVFVDIYEGLFFEGQEVTYNDALELVAAWDYEDNYIEMLQQPIKDFFEDKITKVDNEIETDENEKDYLIDERDALIYEKDKLKEADPEADVDSINDRISSLNSSITNLIDHIHSLYTRKEQYEQDLETQLQSLPNRAQLLPVSIAEINYYSTALGSDPATYPAPTASYKYRTDTVTSNGMYLAVKDGEELNGENISYNNKYIKTGSKFIGDFDITYQVHDDGIPYTDNGVTEYIPNTDVTMEYTRRCKVNFNYNPLLYTQGSVAYNSENSKAETILKLQAVFDSEDTEDNIPWWSRKNTLNADTGTSLLLHPDRDTETLQELQDSLIITGIKEVKFSSAFNYEHPDVVENFKKDFLSPELSSNLMGANKVLDANGNEMKYYIRGKGVQPVYDKIGLLKLIYDFNGGSELYGGVPKSEIYNAITSIDITFDSVDQWGKWSSGKVSKKQYEYSDTSDEEPGSINPDEKPTGLSPENNGGYEWPDIPDDKPWDEPVTQGEEERTTTIVVINDDTSSWLVDNSLIRGYIRDNVRYIDSNWLDKGSLSETYWGDYGIEVLKYILDSNSSDEIKALHSGEYINAIGKKVEINIKDYTE